MAERDERPVEDTGVTTTVGMIPYRRVSWGAIFAGVIIVLVVQAALAFLGVGIGLSTVDFREEANPFGGLGVGAMIWWVISSLIALFLGGFVAARLAGVTRRGNGALHGLVTYGFASLFAFYLMTTAIGAVIGGAFGVVNTSVSAMGQAASNPDITREVRQQTQSGDAEQTWARIQQEVTQLFSQAAGTVERSTTDRTSGTSRDVTPAPGVSVKTDAEAQQMIQRYVQAGRDPDNAADRDAIVNMLVSRTDMSRSQAEQTVDRWTEQYAAAQNPSRETQVAGQNRARAEEYADKAAQAVSAAAIWTFVMLLLGAGAAAWGGRTGSPSGLIIAETDLGAMPADRVRRTT